MFRRRRELAREQAAASGFAAGIRRVVDDQTALAEHPFDPARKRVRHPDAGGVDVRSSASSAGVNSVGGRMRARSSMACRSRRRGSRATGTGSRRPGAEGDGARLELIVEHRAASDLVPIVVFRLDPEDRDGRHMVLPRHLFGQLERGQGLQQREERTAEQTCLLAGDDRHGAGVGQCAARRSPAPAPRGAAAGRDHRAISSPPARMRLRTRDRAGPVGALRRVAGEERRDGAEMVGVIGGEPTAPRKASDVDREPNGRIGR